MLFVSVLSPRLRASCASARGTGGRHPSRSRCLRDSGYRTQPESRPPHREYRIGRCGRSRMSGAQLGGLPVAEMLTHPALAGNAGSVPRYEGVGRLFDDRAAVAADDPAEAPGIVPARDDFDRMGVRCFDRHRAVTPQRSNPLHATIADGYRTARARTRFAPSCRVRPYRAAIRAEPVDRMLHRHRATGSLHADQGHQ